MLIGKCKSCEVHGISDVDLKHIKSFLKDAEYEWCSAHNTEELFAARTLIGGDKSDWNGTPLQSLYNYYLNGNNDNHDYAVSQAGKAVGHILMKVLIEDNRTYETQKGYTRLYRWTGN